METKYSKFIETIARVSMIMNAEPKVLNDSTVVWEHSLLPDTNIVLQFNSTNCTQTLKFDGELSEGVPISPLEATAFSKVQNIYHDCKHTNIVLTGYYVGEQTLKVERDGSVTLFCKDNEHILSKDVYVKNVKIGDMIIHSYKFNVHAKHFSIVKRITSDNKSTSITFYDGSTLYGANDLTFTALGVSYQIRLSHIMPGMALPKIGSVSTQSEATVYEKDFLEIHSHAVGDVYMLGGGDTTICIALKSGLLFTLPYDCKTQVMVLSHTVALAQLKVSDLLLTYSTLGD